MAPPRIVSICMAGMLSLALVACGGVGDVGDMEQVDTESSRSLSMMIEHPDTEGRNGAHVTSYPDGSMLMGLNATLGGERTIEIFMLDYEGRMSGQTYVVTMFGRDGEILCRSREECRDVADFKVICESSSLLLGAASATPVACAPDESAACVPVLACRFDSDPPGLADVSLWAGELLLTESLVGISIGAPGEHSCAWRAGDNDQFHVCRMCTGRGAATAYIDGATARFRELSTGRPADPPLFRCP